MRFTRARDLVVPGLVLAVVSYLALRLAYGYVPRVPVLAGVTLLPVALGELWWGFVLRGRIQRRPHARVLEPLVAARSVALAKASSLAGAVLLGVWLGMIAYVLPLQGQLAAAENDLVPAMLGAVSAAALIAAGLWLEHCCRTPDLPEDRDAP
ncbi:DUF3180 domain-containing protein [Crossiella sp. SN42]|uniref:DUF3180 domain-containing protein n=1 Tax=Crossiella sp. SN42 TaxID=2944808 RepID=UPI00207CC010|nr:DUF3180 domain-containing protein [Crossiella sp. SN42]MCO1578973.1 DUF3180 domain-containing protein [Crossiella sp. SN42]